jgi:hypothetical protein
LDGSAPTEYGAENAVASAALGAGVHFIAVFLIGEDDSEELCCREEGGVVVGNNALPKVTKDQVTQSDSFCFAGRGSEGVLAGAHGIKESPDDQVSGVVVLVGAEATAMGELEQPTEEAGSDGFLA